ncbi:uncharacterized protein LOC111611356 [Xiphophorus maculatus]|uniref:uncharacterized protein LOC111611356 n=1 Tax=Xiphophorus maculatus TaxID=8083 RepID=UPI000C6CD4E5|nr:uncharacterized protein LOC111611356 [Xiphophorus maculatus]
MHLQFPPANRITSRQSSFTPEPTCSPSTASSRQYPDPPPPRPWITWNHTKSETSDLPSKPPDKFPFSPMYNHRMDDLSDFLRQRNIPEETIETMLREKIDTNVIQLMTNEELKNYLPSYGDHIALSGYCKREENGPPSSLKSKLFERLKSKLGKRKTAHEDGCGMEKEEQSETTIKKNALKSKRKIEIGWLLYDEEQQAFKQVRARRGGGTKKVDVSKDAKKK